MKVNILREIAWFGGNYFHPISFDENSFKLKSCLRAGKSVPMHFHKYFDEYWTVLQGTPTFIAANKKYIRYPGETFTIANFIPDSIVNDTKEAIILITSTRPGTAVAKMMHIIAGLHDEKEKDWLINYFFVEKKAGLREFSAPADIRMKLITGVLMPLIMLIEIFQHGIG